MILAFENLTLTIVARQDADVRNIRIEATTMYHRTAFERLTIDGATEYLHRDPIEMYAQLAADMVRRTLQAVEDGAPTLEITRKAP